MMDIKEEGLLQFTSEARNGMKGNQNRRRVDPIDGLSFRVFLFFLCVCECVCVREAREC